MPRFPQTHSEYSLVRWASARTEQAYNGRETSGQDVAHTSGGVESKLIDQLLCSGARLGRVQGGEDQFRPAAQVIFPDGILSDNCTIGIQ